MPKRDGERDLQHGVNIFQWKRHKKELQSNLSKTAMATLGTEKSGRCREVAVGVKYDTDIFLSFYIFILKKA